MDNNARPVIWAAIAGALLILLALLVVPAVYVALAVAVLALIVLVVAARLKERREAGEEDADDEETWDDGGDEWGLVTEEPDDDLVDVDDRLGGLTLADESEPPLQADDLGESATVVEPAGQLGDVDDETIYVEEESFVEDELVEETVYVEDELVEETVYVEDELVEETVYVEEELVEEPVASSIFDAPGHIDEEAVTSDDTILQAAGAAQMEYDEVLTREDANAETREILGRVANLLAKYE